MTQSTRHPKLLTIEQLRVKISEGEIDTVIVAFTDMQGRLQGKRLHGQYFVEHVIEDGTEGWLREVDVSQT